MGILWCMPMLLQEHIYDLKALLWLLPPSEAKQVQLKKGTGSLELPPQEDLSVFLYWWFSSAGEHCLVHLLYTY